VPRLFELPTALLEYLLWRDCSPPTLRVATPIWLWLWNIQCSGTAFVNPFILHRNNHTMPHLHIYRLKRRRLDSLPAMFNQLCSSTNQLLFKKSFCNQSSHYENYRQFNGSHHVPTTKSTLFMANKDEWYTKEGRATSMKNALYVQWYDKRHLSGWSDVEQRKNQAHRFSHCWVTLVWRQAGS